jgi:hypothetical protein
MALLLKKLLFTKVPETFCRFTTIPSIHTKHPGKNRFLAMSPLGVGGGAAGRNSGEPAVLSAGEGAGEVCELTKDRFAAKERSGAAPARGLGGTDRHRPLDR